MSGNQATSRRFAARIVMASALLAATVTSATAITAPQAFAAPPLKCSAVMSSAVPADYSTDYVKVTTAPGASVAAAAHYKTTTRRIQAVAGSTGHAAIAFRISGATPGFKVRVTVTVRSAGRSGSCATSFIPRRKAAASPVVATFTGSGIEKTPRFTVTATWKLTYSFSCASFGMAGNFQVYEFSGSDLTSVMVNDLAMSKSASTWSYYDAGTRYLEINSECSWTVKVIDEP